MDNLPNAIIVETVSIDGVLTKTKEGKFILIKNEDMTEVPVEYIVPSGAGVYYLDKFASKLVKVTGRIWYGKLLADKVDELK